MEILNRLGATDHEQLIAYSNHASGLRCFIAIHDTTLGPALGGVRIMRYATEAEALEDVFRLSRGMTYKASLAGLAAGGGKSVILLHDDMNRAEAFEAFGALVESLGGRYFVGRDVGITDEDLASIARATRFVALEPSSELGDVSEHTAVGVCHALRACLEAASLISADGKPLRAAIQGVGSVGMHLARMLKRDGFELIVADASPERAEAARAGLGARVVTPEEILFVPCDVLVPCALGGILSPQSVPRILARVICGSANNMLTDLEVGEQLTARGILYAPDYLSNAGGLIRGAEFFLLGKLNSQESLKRIYDRMREVLLRASQTGDSTARVADQIAEARLKRPRTRHNVHWHGAIHKSKPA